MVRASNKDLSVTLSEVGNNEVLFNFCRDPNAKIENFGSRHVIITESEKADRIFLLISGSVQVFIKDENSHELVLTYLTDLNLFGEMGFLRQETVRSASVRTRTESKIVSMSYEHFEEYCQTHPQILRVLCEHMASRLKNTSKQMSSMAFDDVQDRVIETIFSLARMPDAMTHPDGMQIRATRQEIGNMLGCSRETVGRVIKSLEEKHVLDTKGKTIVIRIDRDDRF